MNLAEKHPPRKRETVRYKPCYEEGLYIQFLLKTKKHNLIRIGEHLRVSPQIVANVVSGRRRSARIESEIARILGKAGWNEVVLEARSEVQKKPIETILEERRRAYEEKDRAEKESMGKHMAEGAEEAGKIIREGKAREERQKLERKLERAARRRALA